ncbi:oxidoreductase [Streptomyces sp. NBC_01724]|uniref:oxidoreductase n=1 Tax=unclassified Streptomyces TaxID=2593676 RepID=UPI002E31F6C0|nr:oxidoreductase [Streptomyces sp. NBC_01724]WTE49273.1 oxidoreductase [Streptomyces sp. NBC_01620]
MIAETCACRAAYLGDLIAREKPDRSTAHHVRECIKMPTSVSNSSARTWFITGSSQGLGLELVKNLLVRGNHVAATARDAARLCENLGEHASSELFLPLQVDLTDENSIKNAVHRTGERFGSIDVLVNNAGYGLLGSVEETSDAEARAMFDINLFGLWNVTRAVLPLMRAKRRGHIINMSSIYGLVAGAGWGLYNATKFAVEGLSEALALEVEPFGISVTLIEPGYFRTNFLTAGSLAMPKSTIDAYSAVRDMTKEHERIEGSQLGDPVRAAEAIIDVASRSPAPLRLLLGSDALQLATQKIEDLTAGIGQNKEATLSTDFR